ncbi:MAG TPA: 2-succinyl-5-enolpyruvyl-6-hydroxy-3-cyclohexene-1-carboxylic-acid synthase [Acidimicrobiia bacterium]
MNVAALNADYCTTLVDEWVHQGLRHAVAAPGSRSAPLALALARDARVQLEVVLDERSAAFVALGIGRATRQPALVLCTSGTATTHFHAAVVEAHQAGVPMLVVTADRPPELHGIGSAQTIEQGELYGDALRLRCDPGPPDTVAADAWRDLAARSYAAAVGEHPGPVHVNLAFREPLVGPPGTSRGAPTPAQSVAAQTVVVDDRAISALVEAMRTARRGVIVAGWGCDVSATALARLSDASGWPVLADAISNARSAVGAVAHYEALVRVPALADELRPDMVLRFGAALTSKVVTEWLAPVRPHVMVDPRGLGIDPTRSATSRIVAEADLVADRLTQAASGAPGWRERWCELDVRAGAAIGAVLDTVDHATGPQVARDLVRSLPHGAQLAAASSMPVRDLEWFGGPLAGVTAHANRGVNGIDGTIATGTGVAIGSGAPTYVLIGDLAFLHDAGSLLRLGDRDVDLTIVVVDNDGGGIFSFLAQREHSDAGEFEQLFGTPQHVDLVALARAYGVDATRVADADEFRRTIASAVGNRGVRVVVAPVLDRDADVAHHRELWAAAASAVSDDGGAGFPPSAAART